MMERRDAYRVLMGKPGGRRPLGRPRIILKWIFEKKGKDVELHRCLRIGTGGYLL
jgi:hypothetical protein